MRLEIWWAFVWIKEKNDIYSIKNEKEKWDKNYTEYFKLIKEPVDIIVVKWWKIVKQEVVVNEIDKYLWNTNIKNTNYKWYKALYNKLFNF